MQMHTFTCAWAASGNASQWLPALALVLPQCGFTPQYSELQVRNMFVRDAQRQAPQVLWQSWHASVACAGGRWIWKCQGPASQVHLQFQCTAPSY